MRGLINPLIFKLRHHRGLGGEFIAAARELPAMSPKNTPGKEKIAVSMSLAFKTAIDCSDVQSGRAAPATYLRLHSSRKSAPTTASVASSPCETRSSPDDRSGMIALHELGVRDG